MKPLNEKTPKDADERMAFGVFSAIDDYSVV
jgi:hypothetical protein